MANIGGRNDTNPSSFWSQTPSGDSIGSAPASGAAAAAPQAGGTPAAGVATGGYSFQIPPGFDPNNPTDKLVLDQFEKYKDRAAAGDQGSMPTAANMSYWRDQINQHGGASTPSTAQYWTEKMTPGAGGGAGGGTGGGTFGAPGSGGDFGSLASAPGTFQAPSGLTEANDPGFMARMKMGTDAIQASAAAKGSVLSGGTLKALDRYAQDFGSNEYGNIYNRALQGYQTNVGTQRNAQNDYFQRLQSLYSGTGSTQVNPTG